MSQTEIDFLKFSPCERINQYTKNLQDSINIHLNKFIKKYVNEKENTDQLIIKSLISQDENAYFCYNKENKFSTIKINNIMIMSCAPEILIVEISDFKILKYSNVLKIYVFPENFFVDYGEFNFVPFGNINTKEYFNGKLYFNKLIMIWNDIESRVIKNIKSQLLCR